MIRLVKVDDQTYELHVKGKKEAHRSSKSNIWVMARLQGIAERELDIADMEMTKMNHRRAEFGMMGTFIRTLL